MATRVGINGFGRIGRQVLKAMMERQGDTLEVVAINDLTSSATNAHLFKYDTNYGIYEGSVEPSENGITIDGREIHVFAQRDPAQIPWADKGIDLVVESTGFFTDKDKAKGHIDGGGAKKVIISAPAKGEDITMVLGVNDDQYDPSKHNVISNASCTTNCLAPLVKVINDTFGVKYGLMTTVHSYTNDQKILDQVHEDLRRARAAAMNIIPTTTGAARAVSLVLPEMQGKIHGFALRVPTSTVSIVDFVATLNRKASVDDVNGALREASEGKLKGILGYTEEPLVSSDFKANPLSSIVDGLSTMAIGDDMIKAVSWYDNEWGYSCRVADLAAMISKRGL